MGKCADAESINQSRDRHIGTGTGTRPWTPVARFRDRRLPQAIDVEVTLTAVVLDMPAVSIVRIPTCVAALRVGFNQHPKASDFTHPIEPSTDSQSTSSPFLRRS